MSLHLAQDPAADELLSSDPFALLVGMVLDQQFPLERAFAAPYILRSRLGRDLDAGMIAGQDPVELAAVFARPPALHRYPVAMAARVQQLATHLLERYDGDPTAVWLGAPDGSELLRRVKGLPGFGEQKARIFVALLGKQLGVTPPGWERAAGEYAEPVARRSVADIRDPQSLAEVREYKQRMKRAARATTPD